MTSKTFASWLRQAALALACANLLAVPVAAQVGTKVSALPAAAAATGAEIVPCVQGSVTRACTTAQQGAYTLGTAVPALPAASTLTGGEVSNLVQGGAARSTTLGQIAAIGGAYVPQGIDLTGATSATAIVNAALAAYPVVRLPAGTINASPIIPSGRTLMGSGACDYNRSTNAWSTGCTLLTGTVIATDSVGATIQDLAIDVYSAGTDAVDAKSDTTRDLIIRRIATRANNHNILLEKNANTGTPATDAIGATVNNVLVEDVKMYGGPNGIAVKMRGVTIRRVYAFDITTQAFVAVSDIINGNNRYSRAQDVLFDNDRCTNCGQVLHVYSRDNQSTNNASGVLGAKNIRWINGPLSGSTSNSGATIGDSSSLDSSLTRIANLGMWIGNAEVRDNSQPGINFSNCAGCGYANLTFGNNGTVGTAGTVNVNVTYSVGGTVTRLLKGPVVIEDGATNINDRASLHRSIQASTTLTTADLGMTISNYLASASVTATLPAPQFGDVYRFMTVNANGMRIASAAPTTNYLKDGATAAPAYFETTAAGSYLEVTAQPNASGVLYWIVTAKNGAWTSN